MQKKSGPIGVGGDAQNVQLPMLQHALRPQRSAAPTEPSGDCPSGGSCAIYIGMSSIRSIHSIRRTKSLRKSLATNFFGPFPQEIARHKLFRPISSGNRPPQNFFGSFPQEIGRHKLFRLISSGNRPPQNFFGQKPEEIGRKKLFQPKASGNRLPQAKKKA